MEHIITVAPGRSGRLVVGFRATCECGWEAPGPRSTKAAAKHDGDAHLTQEARRSKTKAIEAQCDAYAELLGIDPEEVAYDDNGVCLTVEQAAEILDRLGRADRAKGEIG